MLAVSAEQPFDDPNWWYELKWDGYRALIHQTQRLRIFSRRGQNLLAWFPELAALSRYISAPSVLDAEIVAWHEGGPSFEALAARRGPYLAVVFDCLYTGDGWHLREPLRARRARLAKLVAPGGPVVVADGVAGPGRQLLAAAAERHLEGVMAKHLDGLYWPGRRVRTWQKFVLQQVQWMTAAAADPRPGGGWMWTLVENPDGSGPVVARLTAPVDWRPQAALIGMRHRLTPPLAVEVGYRRRTAAGRLRHASIRQWRDVHDNARPAAP